ncbi:MAG TPA: ABC transporter substrate-binding protein [Mycobacteriales bacterium]|jgi:osmoprotectant transport system substrate-binding protein|nr:ABC transporter substrate-binding protein [Mycobacteriales bacterium]
MRVRLAGAAAAVLVTALLAAGCSDPAGEPSAPKGRLTVGSASAPEAQILAAMYALALEKAGYEVTGSYEAGPRQIYLPAMQRGEIDVLPEYLSGLATYLGSSSAKGEVDPPAGGNVTATWQALQPLLAGRALTVGAPSPATDQPAWAVSKELADRESLQAVSDLGRLGGRLVLGGPPGCASEPSCLVGLQETYGLRFKEVRSVGAVSSPMVFAALQDGSIDVGAVLSSDGRVAADGLVVLDDDKRVQDAGNVVALYRDTVPADARAVVEAVNRALTTEKLQELNKKRVVDGADTTELAKRFLQDARLL